MRISLVIAFVMLFLISKESSAAPQSGSFSDKKLGETCGTCFSIGVDAETCGTCASGLTCMPQKDFGIIVPEKPWKCIKDTVVDLTAITLPPLKTPKPLNPRNEEVPSELESCPEGYALKSGDLPGWGSDLGERLYLSRQQCADKCSKHRDCLSFEHSKTTNLCNLNRIAEPTEGPFQDFAFCMKEKAELNKASVNFKNMNLVCIAVIINLMRLMF